MIQNLAEVDEITARLRREDARLRRGTLIFMLVCVAVGVSVMLWASFSVSRMRGEVADLEARKELLEKQSAERERLVSEVSPRLSAEVRTRFESQDRAQRAELGRLEVGLTAARRGRYEEAIQAYGKALEVNPNDKQALNWRGYAMFRKGSYAEAEDQFRRAIRVDDGYAEAHYNRALALWNLGRKDEAAREFRRATELDPELGFRSIKDPHAAALRRYLTQIQ